MLDRGGSMPQTARHRHDRIPARARRSHGRAAGVALATLAMAAGIQAADAAVRIVAPDHARTIVFAQNGGHRFVCQEGQPGRPPIEISMTYSDQTAVLDLPDMQLVLYQVMTGSGTEYANDLANFREHQGQAVLQLLDRQWSCRPASAGAAAVIPAGGEAFVGAWQGGNGATLAVYGDRIVETSPEGYDFVATTTADPDPAGGPGPDYACRLGYVERSAKELVRRYTEVHNAQVAQGFPTIDPVPPALLQLDSLGSFPVMELECYESTPQYVMVDSDHLLRVNTGEGMIDPQVLFTRTSTTPPAGGPAGTTVPPDEYYETSYQDWVVNCATCMHPEDHYCSISTMDPATAGSLIVHLDPGPRMTVSVPPPADGIATPIWFRVDGQGALPAVPPAVVYEGMYGELVITGEPVGRIVPALRGGNAVELTTPPPTYPGYRQSFSLRGFSAALDDALAHLPASPVACPF